MIEFGVFIIIFLIMRLTSRFFRQAPQPIRIDIYHHFDPDDDDGERSDELQPRGEVVVFQRPKIVA